MKRALILLLGLGLLAQCRRPDPEPAEGTAKLGQTFPAQSRQTVVITDLNTAHDPEPTLRFKLLSLEHESCPPSADCCLASWASAKFTLEFLGQTSVPTWVTFPQCDVLPKLVAKVPVGGRTFDVTMDDTRPRINFWTTPKQPLEGAMFTVR